jgi:NAD(P)-dependent dehydrogenase (short-subunit alcohol dehydrogenase family)
MDVLRDRVAVVTGGASGIGRALAAAFRDAGMQVVIADVETGPLQTTASELGVTPYRVDVARAEDMAALAAFVRERFGTCHVLCNNAGVGGGGLVKDLTLKDWKWVIDVNLWGVVHGVHEFLPMLLANPDGGHIVNTASMAGLFPLPGAAPYAATKYAVVGISETLREELAGTGVGVSVLCPGFVRTNIFASQRNRPEELRNETRNPSARQANDDIARQYADSMMEPSRVAAHVVAAVREGRFWIITHPELLEQVRHRRDELLAAGD